jgi:predicted dehydrogenase
MKPWPSLQSWASTARFWSRSRFSTTRAAFRRTCSARFTSVTDYRETSSASAERGGGVLRDLSHELDLLFRLFGPWRRLAALGGALSDLQIDCDDAWALLLELDGCPAVTLQLNYLDRKGRRDLTVIGEDHSYHADLSGGALTVDGDCVRIAVDADESYLAQHRAILEQEGAGVCTLGEGLAVVGAIEAAERASREGRWIET